VIPRRIDGLPATFLVRGDPELEVTGVSIDSRTLQPGDLFIAFGGGVDFTADAVAAGAAAVIVETDEAPRADAAPALLVTFSPLRALQCLGAENAEAATATRVGITGSSGKTSTKDAVAHLVAGQRRVAAAAKGNNNEIGYPLTLCRIDRDTEVVVCELAMRGGGQIAELCAIAAPDIAAITNVGPAHIELLGSLGAIAAAKAEIAVGVAEGGVVIVPHDEPLLAEHLPPNRRYVSFGTAEGADVRLVSRTRLDEGGQRVGIRIHGRDLDIHHSLVGRHHALNLCVALAVCAELGLDLDAAAERAATIPLPEWRGEEIALDDGTVVVNDAYNANPDSMRAALELLSETPVSGRRIAILGPMAELGTESERYHRETGERCAALGIDLLISVGEPARAYLDGAGQGVETLWVEDADGALAAVLAEREAGDRILVKASRAAALEELPRRICEGGTA
jgi:UDP-N-acetylmuramoyl-tripeptide--D-alanyl-D-alanine ligase